MSAITFPLSLRPRPVKAAFGTSSHRHLIFFFFFPLFPFRPSISLIRSPDKLLLDAEPAFFPEQPF